MVCIVLLRIVIFAALVGDALEGRLVGVVRVRRCVLPESPDQALKIAPRHTALPLELPKVGGRNARGVAPPVKNELGAREQCPDLLDAVHEDLRVGRAPPHQVGVDLLETEDPAQRAGRSMTAQQGSGARPSSGAHLARGSGLCSRVIIRRA